MRGVDPDFQRLQPVAVPVALEGEGVRLGRDEAVEVRKGGRLAGAQVGEKDSALLDHGVRALPDVLAQAAAFGLGRRLQASAADIEQPAMEGAAQAAVLQPAIREIRTAVRAMAIGKTVPAFLVTKPTKILRQ